MMNVLWNICINHFASSIICPKRIRNRFYKLFGIRSRSLTFGDHCVFRGNRVMVGSGCYFNENIYFEGSDDITFEDNVYCGMGCSFINSSHSVGTSEKRAGDNITKPIVVKKVYG